MPERFELTYTGADNADHRPVMIHRALMGSFERFIGILIEHYAGEFPLWLAPVQARVLPLADRHADYAARGRGARSAAAGLRAELDDRTESVGRKIREAELRKVPYMLVVGDREAEQRAVALRRHREGDLGTMPLDEAVARLAAEAAERKALSVQRRDTARLTAALALAVSFAPSLLRRSRREQLAVSAASRGARRASRAPATEVAVMRLANRIEGGEPAARAVLVGAGALATLAELSASPVSGVALAGTVARVGGICALVGAVAPVRDRAAPLEDPRTAAAALAVGAAAFAGWRQLAKRAGPRRVRFEQYPAEAWLDDRQRRRGQPAPARGARLRGHALPRHRARPGCAQDPIRVFAGVRSADTIEERCRLAVAELERLGAFDRSRILVCSATLRGYVSPVPVEAEEHLSRRRRRLRRRAVLRPPHVADAGQGPGRRAHAPRAAARAAGAPRRRRGPARGRDLRREPRRVGEPERLPRRRRALARRRGRRPRAVDRHAVLLPARRGGSRRARCRPTRASASCARRSWSRARRPAAGCASCSSAAARTP